VLPSQAISHGRINETVPLDNYHVVFYVAARGSDETGNGSLENPYASPLKAIGTVSGSEASKRYAILVSEGTYRVNDLQMKPYVDLYGGFHPQLWERDIEQYQTVLDGNAEGRIILAADHSRIDGFFIMSGRFRGNGGAILCQGSSPVISNNVLFRNTTLTPVPWNPVNIHEKAHDGGAVYAGNQASPIIRNNIFLENYTENGRGGAVAWHDRCNGEIRNNVFLNNHAGTNDPARSSDGGAVSLFNWCSPVVKQNLFIGNHALARNDGGGLFIALWSSPTVLNNYFFNNRADDDAGAIFVGGQEHRYDVPLDPLPSSDSFYVKIDGNVIMGNANSSMNSGAMRFTMESRGEFTNNLVAFNNGIYFQRSDADINHNTIVDNFLLIETKQGLEPCRLRNSIVLGKVDLEIEAHISNCLLLDKEDPDRSRQVEFKDDGISLDILGRMVQNRGMETRLIVNGYYPEDILKNRVVKAGTSYTIVKSNSGNELILWGVLPGSADPRILPSYTPISGTLFVEEGTDSGLDRDLYGSIRAAGTDNVLGAVVSR
jgi:hypothetical protein